MATSKAAKKGSTKGARKGAKTSQFNPQPEPPGARASKKGARAGAIGNNILPYGDPIRQAIARGDVNEMKRVSASSRKWLREVQALLDKLDQRIAKVGGTK